MASSPPFHPHPVDVHVGQRIRMLRKMRQMSQSELSDTIGLTFQQIQKYERGANRVSASMLFGIAEALEVKIAYFFEGLQPVREGQDSPAPVDRKIVDQLFLAPGGRDLADAFAAIRSAPVQRAIATLVKAVAANDADPPTDG